jgi:hypothetical protein
VPRRPPTKHDRRLADEQARKLAMATGSRTQPASGALPGAKGDVRSRGRFRAESKFTRNKTFRLTRDLLDKISGECGYHEYPVLDIEFKDVNGRTEDRWVAIPYEIWKEQYEPSDDS